MSPARAQKAKLAKAQQEAESATSGLEDLKALLKSAREPNELLNATLREQSEQLKELRAEIRDLRGGGSNRRSPPLTGKEKAAKEQAMHGPFSKELLDRIRMILERKEQVILFQIAEGMHLLSNVRFVNGKLTVLTAMSV